MAFGRRFHALGVACAALIATIGASTAANTGKDTWPSAARVVITLDVAKSDGEPDPAAIRDAQETLIEAAKAQGHEIRGLTRYRYMPFIAGRVDAPALLYLMREAPKVESVSRDRTFELQDRGETGAAQDDGDDGAEIGLAAPTSENSQDSNQD